MCVCVCMCVCVSGCTDYRIHSWPRSISMNITNLTVIHVLVTYYMVNVQPTAVCLYLKREKLHLQLYIINLNPEI